MGHFDLGGIAVGRGEPCAVVAEIGINHGGSVSHALALIDAAHAAGANAVKFQKRTVDIVYTAEELSQPRSSIFGTTNGDLKRGLEFGHQEYEQIHDHCRRADIPWFASAWDVDSVRFLERFDVPVHKVPSACLTDTTLIDTMARTGKPMMLSTGMSTRREIDTAVTMARAVPFALLVCTSTYPCAVADLHLARIGALRRRYEHAAVIGYSGHETGLWTTLAAVALGAEMVERHLTLDRAGWGSDQSASIEPRGFAKLVGEIRDLERAMGSPEFRCLPCEEPVKAKLRRVAAPAGLHATDGFGGIVAVKVGP